MFTGQQVKLAFQKFRDISIDLQGSRYQTWNDNLRHLIAHCENDQVMKAVTTSLSVHPDVNFALWYQTFLASCRSMMGTNRYYLPTNDDQKTALLYQFLVEIASGNINVFTFCLQAYAKKNGQEAIDAFNAEIVTKFVRSVSYRINALDNELGDERQVDPSALTFINYGTYQAVQGGIHSSVVAAGSTVSGNTIAYNQESFASAVKSLGTDLDDVLQSHHESLTEAFSFLVRAIETNTTPRTSQIATAVEAIGDGSPSKLKSLKTIVEGAAGNLIADALKPLLMFEIVRQGINI